VFTLSYFAIRAVAGWRFFDALRSLLALLMVSCRHSASPAAGVECSAMSIAPARQCLERACYNIELNQLPSKPALTTERECYVTGSDSTRLQTSQRNTTRPTLDPIGGRRATNAIGVPQMVHWRAALSAAMFIRRRFPADQHVPASDQAVCV